MSGFARAAPQVPVVLASLLLWFSFAWALPAEAAAEGKSETSPPAEAVAEDPWAGVKISDAYDYAKCPECGHKNEIRAVSCSRCWRELPQPSGEYTYPPWVWVPGKGYYREGTLVGEQAGKSRKSLWITGLVLTTVGGLLIVGATAGLMAGEGEFDAGPGIVIVFGAIAATAAGIVLTIKGFKRPTEPVYALERGEPFEPYERPAFGLRSPDSGGVALEVELTVLGF